MKLKFDEQGPRWEHECMDCKPLPFDKILSLLTPLSYRQDRGRFVIESADGTAIAIVHLEEDAARIIRAVNAHEDLMSRLRHLTDIAEMVLKGTNGMKASDIDFADVIVRNRELLAKGEAPNGRVA